MLRRIEIKGCKSLVDVHSLGEVELRQAAGAFAGREKVLTAYRHAVRKNYRFFSYGDCMFLS